VYSHHTDHRPLKQVISSSNQILGREKARDPCRELAVAVIGEALHDLSLDSRSNNQGHKMNAVKLSRRIIDAIDFLGGPNLDIWAQFTNLNGNQWREVARRVIG
jgi:hypothetical protein